MQAKEIMVEGANVVTIQPDDSIYTAIRLMLSKRVSGLPVVEMTSDGTRKLVGIVTEGDFLRRRETRTLRRRPRWLEFLIGPGKLAQEYVQGAGRKISEVMTSSPVTVNEDTEIGEIIKLLEKYEIKRVPVVRYDVLVGIITRADLLRALVRDSYNEFAPANGDAEIRTRILREIEAQPWGSSMIDVTVKDGIARLQGVIIDERERNAILVAAENTPGVLGVEDHITFVSPLSGTVLLSPEDERRERAL